MLGAHRARGNLAEDEGCEAPSIGVNKPKLVMRVSTEIFSPVDVREDGFVQFEKIFNKAVVEASSLSVLIRSRGGHGGQRTVIGKMDMRV